MNKIINIAKINVLVLVCVGILVLTGHALAMEYATLDGGVNQEESKPIVKWSQLPDMAYGVNIKSVEQEPFVADDWRCVAPRAVTDVHFWGSYIGWDPGNPSSEPTPGVSAFVIRIFSDIPVSYTHLTLPTN